MPINTFIRCFLYSGSILLRDNFPIGQFFDKGITLKGGQAPAHKHIDTLLQYVIEGRVKLDDIITHTLPLSDVTHGYEIFDKKEEDCVNVVLKPGSG